MKVRLRDFGLVGAALVAFSALAQEGASTTLEPPVHDNMTTSLFLVQRLEYANGRDDDAAVWDLQGWVGRDFNKLWVKTEGERSDGRTEDGTLEVLWARPFSRFFDFQAGLRHDIGSGSRNWLAVGVQGLAPYFFDIEATAYVGSEGRTAAVFEGEYDLFVTQRVVLQPRAELTLYGKSERDNGIGSGLSDAELGLRLRYDFSRQFAPYLGVEWSKSYGKTADLRRDEGERVSDRRWVAGLRLWF